MSTKEFGQRTLFKHQSIPPEEHSPQGHLAKSLLNISHILGMDQKLWLNDCMSSYVLPKPLTCVYAQGLGEIFL
jgi:hypothetical protein